MNLQIANCKTQIARPGKAVRRDSRFAIDDLHIHA